MAHWLLKTEPEEFSWDTQVKRGAKGEPWSGVRNFMARSNMKKMKKGERAFFYHTGDEKQVVGIVEVIKEAYPDPTDEKGVFVCVDVTAVSEELANTPAICRRSYVHQTVVTAFENGALEKFSATLKGRRSPVRREQLLAQVIATMAA